MSSFFSFSRRPDCVLWREGRPFVAGMAAGALVSIKGYGVLLLGLALLRRDGRFLKGAALSFGFLATTSVVVMGPRPWIDFLHYPLFGFSLFRRSGPDGRP